MMVEGQLDVDRQTNSQGEDTINDLHIFTQRMIIFILIKKDWGPSSKIVALFGSKAAALLPC